MKLSGWLLCVQAASFRSLKRIHASTELAKWAAILLPPVIGSWPLLKQQFMSNHTGRLCMDWNGRIHFIIARHPVWPPLGRWGITRLHSRVNQQDFFSVFVHLFVTENEFKGVPGSLQWMKLNLNVYNFSECIHKGPADKRKDIQSVNTYRLQLDRKRELINIQKNEETHQNYLTCLANTAFTDQTSA